MRVKAPNGDVYDLSDTVASGLLGAAGSGWSDPDADNGTTVSNVGSPTTTESAGGDTTGAAGEGTATGTNGEGASGGTGESGHTEGGGNAAGESTSHDSVPERPVWPGGSLAEWTAFAQHLGIDTEGLDRSAIHAAIVAHETPEEV